MQVVLAAAAGRTARAASSRHTDAAAPAAIATRKIAGATVSGSCCPLKHARYLLSGAFGVALGLALDGSG